MTVRLVALGLVAWAAVLVGLWWAAYEPDPEPEVHRVKEQTEQANATGPFPQDPTDPSADHATSERPPTDGMGTRADLRRLVAEVFPDQVAEAFAIIECESGWDPSARSATDDTGLFQINDVHRQAGGVAEGLTVTDLMNPATNTRVARALFDQQGWTPWVCRKVL